MQWLTVLSFTILALPAFSASAGQDRDELIRQARADLRDKDPAVRMEALQELALLGIEGDGDPDRGIAELIARGARDESPEVRQEAIRLLMAGQHREVTLETMLSVLDEIRRDQAKVGRRSGNEDEVDEAVMRTRRRYTMQILDSLGRLPDDRTVKALIDFMGALPRREQGFLFVRVSLALTELGARDGIEAVIQRLGELEARTSTNERARQVNEVQQALRTSAVSLGLKGMPETGETAAADWRRWFSRNQKHYPARLGKISARATDDDSPQ